ncbi:hypothetical protein H1C71_015121 [Ictidomys tridecemlineatus]|nr:hypothetical protein H1C71_015121 [Ictidomys tridecemlineatus]
MVSGPTRASPVAGCCPLHSAGCVPCTRQHWRWNPRLLHPRQGPSMSLTSALLFYLGQGLPECPAGLTPPSSSRPASACGLYQSESYLDTRNHARPFSRGNFMQGVVIGWETEKPYTVEKPRAGMEAQVEGAHHGEGSPAPSETTEKVDWGCAPATKGSSHCRSNWGGRDRDPARPLLLWFHFGQHLPLA